MEDYSYWIFALGRLIEKLTAQSTLVQVAASVLMLPLISFGLLMEKIFLSAHFIGVLMFVWLSYKKTRTHSQIVH